MNKRSRGVAIRYILPAFIIYTVFMIYPLIISLFYSFFKWDGMSKKVFVGIGNYVTLFTQYPYNEQLSNVFINNIQFFVLTLIFQNVVALSIAFMLSKKAKGSNFFRFLFFMPTTLSVIIVGYLWSLMLNPTWGSINAILKAVGLGGLAHAWLGDPATALTAIAVANAWQYVGIPMMMFAAAINNIDKSVEESALIDGCGEFKRIWYISLPLLKPTIGMTTVMLFVRNFSAFEIIYSMAGSAAGPMYSTDVFGTFFYRTLFGEYGGAAQDYGMGATIATVMLSFVVLGVGIWLYFEKRSEKE